jgi:cellulose synthase/poly-beta-1,6-N-acetylglucosamine synthase-like glycosyltransferase
VGIWASLVAFVPFHIVAWPCVLVALFRETLPNRASRPVSCAADEALPLLSGPEDIPMVIIIIPCYREDRTTLLDTLGSVLRLDYPKDRVHVFLAFDGYDNKTVFHDLSTELSCTQPSSCRDGHVMVSQQFGCSVTLCLFKHGGKLHAQWNTLAYLRHQHPDYLSCVPRSLVLFVDSDTTLKVDGLAKLVSYMVRPPQSFIPRVSREALTLMFLGIHSVLVPKP